MVKVYTFLDPLGLFSLSFGRLLWCWFYAFLAILVALVHFLLPPRPWGPFQLSPHLSKSLGFFSALVRIPSRFSSTNLGSAPPPGDYSPCLNKITSG